jgi:lactate dehydrogenase-like 2-hydroxyacid dehydrogenase
MRLSILYPDLQFDDEPTIETAVFGDRADLVIFRESARPAVPDAAWARCDAMVCYHFMAIDAGVVAKLERCRLIVRAGVGFDQIDIAACAARGIPVCNTPDYGTMDVADHAMASILALARGTVTSTTRSPPTCAAAGTSWRPRPCGASAARSAASSGSGGSAPPRRCAPRLLEWTWSSTIPTGRRGPSWPSGSAVIAAWRICWPSRTSSACTRR